MAESSREPEAVAERYERRKSLPPGWYDPLAPQVLMGRQEKERALVRWIARAGMAPLKERTLLEIGCGSGANLIEFMRLGFDPANLAGNELLDERLLHARKHLPQEVRLMAGDASSLNIPSGSFDIVFQSTVFTSLLDNAFQEKLAARMWDWVKPGGGLLWYDFQYNNPSNPDVRGVSLRRVRELFPQGKLKAARITLAPPISRRVCRIHPALYTGFNLIPWFRTHLLCWIEKDAP